MMNGKVFPLMLTAMLLFGGGCAVSGVQTGPATSAANTSTEKPSLETKLDSAAFTSALAPAAKPKVIEKSASLAEKESKPELSEPAQVSPPVGQSEAEKQTFDMNTLIERLKETEAIGIFSKLALRSDALDLVDSVKQYKASGAQPKSKLEKLRASFNGLVLKVLALLNGDPGLAQNIRTAQNEIWNNLLEVDT